MQCKCLCMAASLCYPKTDDHIPRKAPGQRLLIKASNQLPRRRSRKVTLKEASLEKSITPKAQFTAAGSTPRSSF